MKQRVIKFNLVGSIFVLLLIIASIVSAVIWVNNSKKDKEENKALRENNKIEANTGDNAENAEKIIDEDAEVTEVVTIDGEEREIVMRVCKGSFGYAMKYDTNGFYVDKLVDGVDKFSSLNSNTIYINVIKDETEFSDKVNDVILDTSRSTGMDNYEITYLEIDGRNTCKESMINGEENLINYYIEASDGCFVIEVHCGNGFVGNSMPVIEKMVESFEVI